MRVLIAEDDDNDALLLRRAISKVDPEATFYIVGDGQTAIAYLKGEGEFEDRKKFPFPRVLVTDLKMPKMDGFQLLDWIQNHPNCNIIPKIVMSASNIQADVIRAYQLGANIFFQKPATFDALVEVIKLNFRVWSEAELPPDTIVKCG